MNNLNYFRAEGIFGQEEKVRKDSREEKREARIIEIKNSIEDGFVSFQKSNSHVQTDLSEIPKLKSEFNLLTFQNHQKSETLSRLKTEVQTLTSFHKTAHFKSQLTTPRNSVCNFQVSQLASFNLSLDEQEELIHKLNSEILKINSLIDSESLVSDQLEYMKTNEKGKHNKIQNKLAHVRSTFSGIKRYEKDLIDTHVQADNQLIIAVHDMKNQKNETIKERSQRNLKLSHMKKKELHLKQTNSNLTQKLSENIAKSEENFENKLDSEVKIASALSEFLDLKEMSQNYKNQLRFYKEEFIKIRNVVKQSECLDADPVLVDLYTPEDIADALTKMTQIEAQLQTRFQNLTVVQRNLHDKCEEMSVQLVRIKADMQDSTAMDRIKEKAQVLAKSNNMTTNELLSSIDTIGDDTMRAELIENYEKFSTYSVKFIVSVFADIWNKLEFISKNCPEDEIMSIYLLRSKKTYKELQEDINPRSSSTRSMTTIHRNSKKRLFTTKSPGASPISKAKINFEQEPSKEINKTYTKQELIDVLIQKFSISQSKAEIYANEILKKKSEIWSLMDSYRRHNDSLNEGFLSCLYLEASGNLCKKFESSLVILITALDVIKKVNTEIKSQIDSVDLETIKQKNAISSVLNSSKNRSKSLFITSIDQLVKQVISLKLKDQKSKDAKEDYDSYMKTFSTQKKTLKFEDKPGSDLFISLRDLSNRSKDITVDEPLLSTSRSRKSSTKHAKNVNSLPILPKIDEKSEAYKNFKDIELKIKNIKKMGRSTATSETRSAYSKTPSISIEI